jgi:2'-5' RNA ligase
VTVARVGHPQDVTAWVRLLDGYRGPAWIVDRLSLVASHLGEGPRGRPRYEPVEDFALSG